MDLRKLKTLIDLVAESGISELEVTEGDGKVRIVKQPPQVVAAPMAMPQMQAMPVAGAPSTHTWAHTVDANIWQGVTARTCTSAPPTSGRA